MDKNNQMQHLLPHQRQAFVHVQTTAQYRSAQAYNTIKNILASAGLDINVFDNAISHLQSHSQIAIHFHPERLVVKGHSVAEGLLQDGIYKSQFETGLSRGRPTAFPGGNREYWEGRLFGGAYHVANVDMADYPKYGALAITKHPNGPAPRFGSSFFLLRPEVSKRSTFTFGKSYEDLAPERTGTLTELTCVMAAIFTEVEKNQRAFGVNPLTVSDLLAHLSSRPSNPFHDSPPSLLGIAPDSFVEAQIHGTIHLADDVEGIVADPSFRGGSLEEVLLAMSAKYHLPLHWHLGFTLPVANVPDTFRGYAVKPLAARIAGQGTLNAAKIGAAANTLQLNPESWKDWGTHDNIITQFRKLWDVLVLYGKPNQAPARPS